MLAIGVGAALAASVLFNLGTALRALDARNAPEDEALRLELLAWGAPAQSETVRSTASAVSVLAVLGVLALIPFALRGGRRDTTTIVIVGSALGFGATNIATKLVSDSATASHWLPVVVWLA